MATDALVSLDACGSGAAGRANAGLCPASSFKVSTIGLKDVGVTLRCTLLLPYDGTFYETVVRESLSKYFEFSQRLQSWIDQSCVVQNPVHCRLLSGPRALHPSIFPCLPRVDHDINCRTTEFGQGRRQEFLSSWVQYHLFFDTNQVWNQSNPGDVPILPRNFFVGFAKILQVKAGGMGGSSYMPTAWILDYCNLCDFTSFKSLHLVALLMF